MLSLFFVLWNLINTTGQHNWAMKMWWCNGVELCNNTKPLQVIP